MAAVWPRYDGHGMVFRPGTKRRADCRAPCRLVHRPGTPLVIITGAGRHSAAQKARIRPAVLHYLEKLDANMTTTEGDITVHALG